MEIEQFICDNCNNPIPDASIKWKFVPMKGSDDEYTKLRAKCPYCGKKFEYDRWSDVENIQEAKEALNEARRDANETYTIPSEPIPDGSLTLLVGVNDIRNDHKIR